MINIRPVALSDRAAWLRLRCALWPDGEAAHLADMDRFFEAPYPMLQAVFVAEAAEAGLVGFAECSIRIYAEGCTTDHVGYLEGWYVAPDYRQHGIGRRLVEAGEVWARAQGSTEFASDADWHNEVSARAHHACGFEEVAVVRCFRKAL